MTGRLDHAGVIVRDLGANARAWERMGFLLSPVSRQSGRMPGRDETGPWATANRCAIFRDGYLELIGVVDDACFNPWASFLDRFEGMHILALRVESADEAWETLGRIPAHGGQFNPPVQRERSLDVDGELRTMRFRNIFSRDAQCPEGRIIVIEHQTPQYLWQPKYLDHPNGAVALQAVFLCCDLAGHDLPTHPCARIAALTGARPVRTSRDSLLLRADTGHEYCALSPEAFERRFGAAAPAVPAYVGATVRFADRGRAAALMQESGLVVNRTGEDWYVRTAANPGFVLSLAE
jgi:hypothetical protein